MVSNRLAPRWKKNCSPLLRLNSECGDCVGEAIEKEGPELPEAVGWRVKVGDKNFAPKSMGRPNQLIIITIFSKAHKYLSTYCEGSLIEIDIYKTNAKSGGAACGQWEGGWWVGLSVWSGKMNQVDLVSTEQANYSKELAYNAFSKKT